jgi:hypothetical protein
LRDARDTRNARDARDARDAQDACDADDFLVLFKLLRHFFINFLICFGFC